MAEHLKAVQSSLALAAAARIVDEALAIRAKEGLLPLAVAVLDAGGNLVRQGAILVALGIAMALMLICLLLARRLARLFGDTGASVIGRVLGVLLAALAAQIALDGIRQSLGLA